MVAGQTKVAVYFSPRNQPQGNEVGQPLRRIVTAYPSAFDGLMDITLQTTGAQDESLVGSSALLHESTNRLEERHRASLDQRRLDYPEAATRADDTVLAGEGFQSRGG
jgi:mannosyltransferase